MKCDPVSLTFHPRSHFNPGSLSRTTAEKHPSSGWQLGYTSSHLSTVDHRQTHSILRINYRCSTWSTQPWMAWILPTSHFNSYPSLTHTSHDNHPGLLSIPQRAKLPPWDLCYSFSPQHFPVSPALTLFTHTDTCTHAHTLCQLQLQPSAISWMSFTQSRAFLSPKPKLGSSITMPQKVSYTSFGRHITVWKYMFTLVAWFENFPLAG